MPPTLTYLAVNNYVGVHLDDFLNYFNTEFLHAPQYAKNCNLSECISNSHVYKIWPDSIVKKGSISFNAIQRINGNLQIENMVIVEPCHRFLYSKKE